MGATRLQTLALPRAAVHKGPLVLVNKAAPLKTDMPPLLAGVGRGVRLEANTATAYRRVIEAIRAEGRIVPVSGYRSREEQRHIYAATAADSGADYARTYVALPGCSEHQSGLAIDVALWAPHIDFIAPHFPYDDALCRQFREAAVAQGFIQRYPRDKQHVTGIGHEPWHFRYVGAPHAGLITARGLALEEYIQWLRQFCYPARPCLHRADGRVWHLGHLPAGPGACTQIALPAAPCTLSGNNVDGFIIAVDLGEDDTVPKENSGEGGLL